VEEVSIYARVNPSYKMRIVEALKKHKHIVAMTGDGVNDAPALKMADIGIAMGVTGTDVAKEASDMVLLDDHFNTIVSAIEEGRGVFDNIRKFVTYLLSSNIGEIFIVFLSVLIFQDIPLTATMLLWVNVITDGLPAVALGMDPAERGIMRYSPKKFQGEIITKRLWVEMVCFGILLAIGVLGIFWLNLPEGVQEARAAAFTALVLFELLRVLHIRSGYNLSFLSNPWLIGAVITSAILQVGIVYIPAAARLFEVKGIDSVDWFYMVVVGAVLWLLSGIVKHFLDYLLPDKPTRKRKQAPVVAV
jgi:Ca2+-transporting ATPase